jgi:hypothetical protein
MKDAPVINLDEETQPRANGETMKTPPVLYPVSRPRPHPPSDVDWWRRPVRMMRWDYGNDFAPLAAADMDELARQKRELWQVNCEWIMVNPGCAPGMAQYTLFNSDRFEKMPGLGQRDLVREYLPHARRHGIHVLAYVNLHFYSHAFADAHPDWEQVLEDGTAYGRKHPLYGSGTTFCPNSGWRDWALEMIREVMRTGVDGCFLDGPVFFPSACYCASCRRLFFARSRQRRLPRFDDWNDPLWKAFAGFRADSLARFMKEAQSAARTVNRRAVIFLNGGRFTSRNITHGYDTARLEPFQTFTGAEQFFHCTGRFESPYQTMNLARFLSAGRNPAVVFTHHALSIWHYTPLPATEMATALAQTAAGGANSWFAVFHEALKQGLAQAAAPLADVGRFIASAESYTCGDRSAAETAVLISNSTLYHYVTRHRGLCQDVSGGREEALVIDAGTKRHAGTANHRRNASAAILDRELRGCLDVCNFRHIPARVLWDNHLDSAHLRGARVIVLPNAACLSARQLSAVQRFVQTGGGLLTTFESGMYDELGEPVARQRWLRFLGIERVDGVFVPSRTEDYLTLTRPLDALPAATLLPRPVNALAVRATADVEVLARYLNPIGKAYAQLRGVSDYPAAWIVRRGHGRVVYAASPLFESFDQFHLDEHGDLARALLRLAAGPAGLQVETNAPGSLAIELRSQPGRLLIHLVNVTGEMKRPMGRITPLRDVSIELSTCAARQAVALRLGQTLKLERLASNRIRLRLPQVNDYEIIVLTQNVLHSRRHAGKGNG